MTRANAEALVDKLRPGDVVVLHDPQTAGLAPCLTAVGARVVWRCHIGADTRPAVSERAWGFLRGFIASSAVNVFSRRAYAPDWIPGSKAVVIPPSIDPLSPKNQPLSTITVAAIVGRLGVVADNGLSDDRYFTRRDGRTGEVSRQALIDRDGTPPAADVPLVVQVSRWDPLKDMSGVLRAFARISRHTDAHLALVGPDVAAVTDDPTASAEYEACRQQWEALPSAVRRRIQLVRLPMEDAEENAAMVNALQRHATVVVQKSKAEGFGLTVTEAMWKSRPVLASRVGGLVDQIDSDTGILVEPDDVAQCATAMLGLLNEPARRAELGAKALRRVHERFLPDTHLHRWASLLSGLLLE